MKIGGNYRAKVVYDCFGFPDFSPFAAIIVNISDDMQGNYTSDFTSAKNVAIKNGVPASTFNLNDNRAIIDGIEFTWHHHQDCETMMLVPSALNDKFKHLGGNALVQAGLKGKIPKFGEVLNCN